MFCPKCGKINPDSCVKCSGCGAELQGEKTETPKKRKNWIKIAVTLLLIAIVIAVAVLILNGCDPGNIAEDNISF